MQSSLFAASTSRHYQTPWPVRFTAPRSTPRLRTSSLRTSVDHGSEEFVAKEPWHRTPVAVQKSGKVFRYVWDGDCLRLVGVDSDATPFGLGSEDGIRNLGRVCGSGIRDLLMPKEVSENYLDYVKWKFLHRVFSSALQVIATQAMFRAIGIGFSRSLPSAAALNWLLKDGLGRLSRCVYTASLATSFDTNLKRVRFLSSILFTLSVGVELLTPAFPNHFLLLASIANIAKQISLASYLATGSTVYRSFAIADNLGEVSAKSQIQTVCFDNLGLLLAAAMNMLVKNNERLQAGLPFVVYPIFSAIDLFAIYQALKHVHLQTLTKDRLEIILDTWIEQGYVPSPAEVSKKEGIDLPWSQGKDSWPIRVGCVGDSEDRLFSKLSMMAMRSLNIEDYYFVSIEALYSGMSRKMKRGILLSLREGAGRTHVIMGLLQGCYIRKALGLNPKKWDNILEAGQLSELVLDEWFKLLEECKARSRDDVVVLEEHMSRSGWATKNILLSRREQIRYSYIDE